MTFIRHFLSFITLLLCLQTVYGQSASVAAIDESFRAITESGDRILGLDYGSAVFASSDGGNIFTEPVVIPERPLDVYYSMAASGNTVIAVGTDGLIARSTTQGSSWTEGVNSTAIVGDLSAVAVQVGDPSIWIAAGADGSDGVVFLSEDDGATWSASGRLMDVPLSGAVWTGAAWLVCGLDEDAGFAGAVFRSEDGSTWAQVSLSVTAPPLTSLASDGQGNVVAVGESGAVLYSSDHGQNFAQIAAGAISEDLGAVVALGTNNFVIGGGGKSLLQTRGSSLSILRAPAGGAPAVEALLATGGTVFAAGDFTAVERTEPFSLEISENGTAFRLSVSQSLSGKTYTLESSTNLLDWAPVGNSSTAGVDGPLEWIQFKNGSRRFWRVEEF